jgi:hypothetical protein
MVFFEITKDPDVRQSESGPAAQGNPNGGPVRLARLLAWGPGYEKNPCPNSATQNPMKQPHGGPHCEATLRNALSYVGVESDLPVLAAGLGPNLERKRGELLFGKTGDTFSAILVSTLQKDETRFGTINKSIHRNRSDWRVKDELRVIRLMDERANISNDVPEM